MKILVTGSTGFIGSHLTSRLAGEGHEVIGFDKKEPVASFGVSKFFRGNLLHKQDLLNALDGVDAVVHLAAVHFDYGHADEEYFETNEQGSQVLTEAMQESGVERLVFSSSIAVYGDRLDEPDEETTPAPTSVYGRSKLAAEGVVKRWAEQASQRRLVIIRPCVVYGERNVTNMLNLIRQVHSGFFVLFGSGTNVKATAYVGNLVEAIVGRLEAIEPGVQLYNYADKPDMSVAQVVSTIRQAMGRSPHPIRCPLWLGTVAALPFEAFTRVTGKNLPVSLARVRKLAQPTRVAAERIRSAGFEQPVSSAEGLTRMVRHYLEQRAEQEGSQAS